MGGTILAPTRGRCPAGPPQLSGPEARNFRIMRLLATLAGSLALVGAACSSGGEASGAQRPRGERIVPVAAAPVQRRDLARSVVVTGPVEPVRTIGVNSLMAGTVLDVRAQEGDWVRAGQLLAELDARETQAQLERARAVLANAEAIY